jgi:hypothetical protein
MVFLQHPYEFGILFLQAQKRLSRTALLAYPKEIIKDYYVGMTYMSKVIERIY